MGLETLVFLVDFDGGLAAVSPRQLQQRLVFVGLLAVAIGVLQGVQRALVATALVQVPDVAVAIREHFLEKFGVVVIDALLLLVLVFLLDLCVAVVFVYVRFFLDVLCKVGGVQIDSRNSVLRAVAETQTETLLRVHELHNFREPRFDQQIVFLLDEVFATEHRRVSLERATCILSAGTMALVDFDAASPESEALHGCRYERPISLVERRHGSFHLG
jgi:hypothetical protein